MMDVLITWDFKIRWLRNFSFSWRKWGFFWWCYDLLCTDVRGVEQKIITPKIPCAWTRRKEDKGTSVEKMRNKLLDLKRLKHLVSPTIRLSGSLLWKARRVKKPLVRGGNAHHPKILKAAVQSAGLCSLFQANYNVIGAWENRALWTLFKLFEGLKERRCRSS